MSTVSKGKEFEDQVAELYRLMGYEVAQNVGILGHQIDIILTYTMPGGIKTKTAVECKYVGEGNLGKNDAMDNINALRDFEEQW
jgi:Holliday junction resolvase-like predicted endonuclease